MINVAELTQRRRSIIMVTAGIGLILVQVLLFREVGTVLHSTELSLTLVLIAYFLSISLGYLLSIELSSSLLLFFLLLLGVIQIFLVPLIRGLGILGQTQGWELFGYLSILGLTSLVASSLFSIFLPRFSTTPGFLVRNYLLELFGSALGVILSAIAVAIGGNLLINLHIASVIILLSLLIPTKKTWTIFIICAFLLTSISISIRDPLNARFFAAREGVTDVRVLASEYSPYQKIDIFDAGPQEKRHRYFYLNGWRHVGGPREDLLNQTLASLAMYLPGVQTQNVMIVGSGISTIVPILLPHFNHIKIY